MKTRLVTTALMGLALGACGPVQSTSHLVDADVQLQAARTARAEQYAPYEWTAANLYLHKAREEVGYSDYDAAVSFARKATRFATEARQKALAANRSAPAAEGLSPSSPR
ncbi:MAG TPA: DUF4398 domain-containing protein [Myxococcaceae bacterium]|nr:DUF4398 domain-containing protein [Myxococcaceae bacterium]